MIRFALHPDYVHSVNDGDWHFISAQQLAHLYGVRPYECIVIPPKFKLGRSGINPDYERWRADRQDIEMNHLLHLHVSYQGAGYWQISEAERHQYPLAIEKETEK